MRSMVEEERTELQRPLSVSAMRCHLSRGERILRAHLPQAKVSARRLRKTMSLPEVLLWQELKKRPSGLKFRRQHPYGHYILDFYCDIAKLVVEIDGEAHDRGDQPARDNQRDDWLRSQGLGVLRIPAKEVLTNLDGVLPHIIAFASEVRQTTEAP